MKIKICFKAIIVDFLLIRIKYLEIIVWLNKIKCKKKKILI
jgi:hypothetical protein